MKKLLDYIDGKAAEDDYTKELEKAVQSVRRKEKWRLEYMTLEMHYQEKYEEGLEQGMEQGINEGLEQGNRQSAMRMLEDGELSLEKIALYSGLTVEQVTELKKNHNTLND